MTSKKSWVSLAVAGTGLVVIGGLLIVNVDAASTSAASDFETATSDDANAIAASLSTSALWDSSEMHSISLSYDDAEYEAMIDTYLSSGDKEWITADVVIDGTTLEDVGLKLKGNSSLRGLSTDADAELSAQDPASLPWIITLDKYVDGQSYDGANELVVRGNSSETALNEALALELLDESGLAAEQAASVAFEVDGDTSLRLVIENPNDEWADRVFDNADALYKAESGGDYSYRGDEASAYDEIFDQEAGDADLVPLTSFLQFIDESDDATFSAELGEWLDVDAFATYLAFQELVGNPDDIDGPGNNSYLEYDSETSLMTVTSWDLNLTFGVTNNDAPGAVGGAANEARGEQTAPVDGELPDAAERPVPPAGGPVQGDAAAPDADADADAADGAAGVGAGGGQGGQGSNILSERFMADADFAELYQAELDRLTDVLFTSGFAQSSLDEWAELLTSDASNLVSTDVVADEAASVVENFPAAG
ncbi:CotH kinase family protein (plasmid) [Coraliomargarita sp. W4R53]